MSVLKGVSTTSSGGGGTVINKGTALIDFGAFPGSNEATVVISGQSGITSSSVAEAILRREATFDHTLNDHDYAGVFISLLCSVPIDGVGFTIVARSSEKLQGTFNLDWKWI